MIITVTFTIFISNNKTEVHASEHFYANAKAYGFNVSSDYEQASMWGITTYKKEHKEGGQLNYGTYFADALVRSKSDPSLWIYICIE